MDNYDLDIEKVIATVTDNGTNFIKAFKEFGFDTILYIQNKMMTMTMT